MIDNYYNLKDKLCLNIKKIKIYTEINMKLKEKNNIYPYIDIYSIHIYQII